MPQQTSTFEACSWVPILQVDGPGKILVNCFSKAIATWRGRESNPRPPDLESDALTTPPCCPIYTQFPSYSLLFLNPTTDKHSDKYTPFDFGFGIGIIPINFLS
ncbi:hypothetical protein ElyMa_001231800 [Elysia marginata]|uniref:Uncharacterized protein n=1 Tax=Elysia marginata TaxID=1093978 RepID=A0AAV4IF47_9GAST|nr:hypothetical protein ElyMa_001231800 [Elysia marginata]